MPDDDDLPSKNPFIRFKQHVDSRIGSGLSVLTGGPRTPETVSTGATSSEPPRPLHESMDNGASNPGPTSSWVDSLLTRGNTPHDALAATAAQRYWNEWAQLSTYSPYNLRHLEPPVPAGVSKEDAPLFDFEDAFEDLLAATQGRNLMDLRKQADYKRSIRGTFLFGEPPMLWVNRLSSAGLLPTPLPPRRLEDRNPDALTGHESKVLKGVEAQQQRLRAIQAQHQNVKALETLKGRREDLEDAMSSPDQLILHIKELKEKMLKELDQDITFNPATIFRQIEEMTRTIDQEMRDFDPAKILPQAEAMLRNLDKVIETFDPANLRRQAEEEQMRKDQGKQSSKDEFDEFNFEKFLHDNENNYKASPKRAPKGRDEQKPHPDTEEDFFSAIFGALMEANTSTRTSTASATETQPTKGAQVFPRQHGQPLPVVSEVEEVNAHGGKTVRWSSVTADPSGRVHEQTVVRILDSQGNEISRETRSSERYSSSLQNARAMPSTVDELQKNQNGLERARREADCGGSGSGMQKPRQEDGGKSGKSTGWFWT
ncbi:unnamed protein product [Discula destructiva]